ncbi:MAG TPA: HIT family protein [Xanthobacteraceae bacterium]|nr:HIT family protein [Xanthobacteraceae bacterium]
MANFSLDPRLAAESFSLGDLALCEVRLFDDARFPWLILVPKRDGAAEIIDLEDDERPVLMNEIEIASAALKRITNCHKLNVAALGNQVRQLHVHVIARFENDAAWPQPVWGKGTRVAYHADSRDALSKQLRDALNLA